MDLLFGKSVISLINLLSLIIVSKVSFKKLFDSVLAKLLNSKQVTNELKFEAKKGLMETICVCIIRQNQQPACHASDLFYCTNQMAVAKFSEISCQGLHSYLLQYVVA